jgi:hypothetical protein
MQAQIAAAEAQPVRSIQTPFDFHLRSTQPRTDFFPWYPPTVAVPTDGVIVGHLARDAHAQNLLQALFSSQPAMRIACMAWHHRETPLPLRQEAGFQEVIGRCDVVDSRQAHFLHQTVLQGFKQPLDAPLGMSVQLRRIAMLRFDVSE